MSETKPQGNPYDLPVFTEQEERKAYWLGTLPTLPQYNCAIGGIQFHRFTDPPVGTDPDSGATQRAYAKGCVELLTRPQVDHIMASMKDCVVRFHGSSGRGSIHKRSARYYTREREDQPIAMHLYMTPLSEATMVLRENPKAEYPPSVYSAAGGVERPRVPVRDPWVPEVAPGIEDLDREPVLAGKGR